MQCVKEIRIDDKMSELIFVKERELLLKLKSKPHRHVVDFKGWYCTKEQFSSFSSIKKGYIQMEKGITNLKDFMLSRKEHFSEDTLVHFINTMVDVFEHLQTLEVAHRDIKPSNILIFQEEPLVCKVCDIGAGTAVGFYDKTKEMTVTGTPYYLSPELYLAHKNAQSLVNYKAYKSDCYSLGLVCL